MAVARWLIDKSALARLGIAQDREEWAVRIERGLVAWTTITQLEVGFSARSLADHVTVFGRPPMAALLTEHLSPAAERRALDVQRQLAAKGQHRAPGVADLLVAASAEVGGMTLLHVDKDFELIAEVTRQPVERLRLA